MERPARPLADRFWENVDKSAGDDGCWLWMGGRNAGGYGQMTKQPGSIVAGAHRVSWELAHGREIPLGMEVCHACDNPPCVNPNHLEVATHRANVDDAMRKGHMRGRIRRRPEVVLGAKR